MVKPPQKPVVNSNLAWGDSQLPCVLTPDRKPMMRHPSTLTVKVPNGKLMVDEAAIHLDTTKRRPPPKKLPTLTNSNSFILYNI